jgi:hypothetical protein
MVFGDTFELPVAPAREVYESAIPNSMSMGRKAG